MRNFEVVIGIEVHCALNTKTKMFSNALLDHEAPVNTNINEIDLALVGTMPNVNMQAIHKGLFLAKALHMQTNHKFISFDRKHYFYLDLPKGYQITQQYYPIGYSGFLEIKNEHNQMQKIRINRIHIEEDTAKQTNLDNKVLLDYNRAGWPLIEIVSEADIRSATEAASYLEELRKILLFHNISDAKMEDGSMRADINISVRLIGDKNFNNKVEIKNINSISNVIKAIEFEKQRQINALLANETIKQQTRRYDDQTQSTIYMRDKGDAIDYKYIPEPNIAPISLSDDYLNELYLQQPQTINDVRNHFLNEQLNPEFIENLLADQELFEAFNYVNKQVQATVSVYKWVCLEFLGLIKKDNKSLKDISKDLWDKIATMISMFEKGEINGKQAKSLLEEIYKTNKDPKVLVKELGYEQISDPVVLEQLLSKILNESLDKKEQFSDRADRYEKYVMGMLMKETKAQANPVISYEVLKKLLGQ
ncbi:Asp-tRNA(Asn)/Glu-tRNA(Gln) amidotransferase subunit GatB [Ureaplasma miroungigenitalium]|uniref:Aspartyl/glutamyl-tRNA(Asn/Gln) amidotransferase subunit B n=1 Tax=Ureaplasma miroungigenitalium TaxID=1042321 RepID=A0ABT3BMQ8_9BACT|nr:Asp-tRNA(Asn)/Glu-tRNA(Gln) amidotransferase subunit GatB [Ureaplasma miroungigenitalium]MCV3728437.1 Asp-tRNA(Asn)/Glu-tRNA(Gln) amidotransferase subunit GatB [Ureaplasma miroungigenitalium]MCV3734224.1 Asp-tRNA(Asn)/Glu-tRNA(Gln) amidotransferase subunit GatB [Ureaplasma miroungigenitalium]